MKTFKVTLVYLLFAILGLAIGWFLPSPGPSRPGPANDSPIMIPIEVTPGQWMFIPS